jgi:site-specific recombinase XerD
MIKAFLKAPDKSGLSRLYFVYRNIWVRVGVKVLSGSWDHEKQVIKSSMPHHKELNGILNKRKSELTDILLRLEYDQIPVSPATIRKYWKVPKAVTEPTVADLMEGYAKDNMRTLAHNHTRKFLYMADKVRAWKDVAAKDFDQVQMNNFVTHLIEKGLQNGSIHDYVRKIRLAIQTAQKRGVHVHPDCSGFRFKYIQPKPVWLTEKELKLLEAFTPTEKGLVYRDEFLFRSYTGLRFSDVQQLRPHHFIKRGKDVYLDFSVIKTRLDQNILLSSKASAIARRWGFTAPKLYQQDCNERIKQIARAAKLTDTIEKVRYRGNERLVDLLPKHKMITTHVARRTFGRIWMERGGDIFKLSKYYGHSSIEQTSAYIGWTTEEVNEELKRLMG